MSPREAAAHNPYRDELERMVRSFEHHSARERDDARPGPEVAWIRAELGLDGRRPRKACGATSTRWSPFGMARRVGAPD